MPRGRAANGSASAPPAGAERGNPRRHEPGMPGDLERGVDRAIQLARHRIGVDWDAAEALDHLQAGGIQVADVDGADPLLPQECAGVDAEQPGTLN